MGIQGFFKWLTDKDHYPDITKNCVECQSFYDEHGVYQPLDETQANPNGIEFDNLYLDMNGIIHLSTKSDDYSKPKSEDEIIKSIFDCIDRIFSIVRPRKLLYMAVDGVAPRAKLNQQRSRRYREVKNSHDKAAEIDRIKSKIRADGNSFPDDQNHPGAMESFDENCITPGTSFMIHLSICLRYYIYNRMNTNAAWSSIKVILSDANVPGEGEHKIMNYIRRQRTQPGYNGNTRHVLFGNDADLIVLGLATHERYVTIMRVEFNRSKSRLCDICRQAGHDFKECKGISKEKLAQPDAITSSTANDTKPKYIFVDLSILRGRLFQSLPENDQFSFKWKLERFIDDWVFICLLVGNDFLPGLPSFEIYEKVIDKLLNIYWSNVPKFNDYLTNNGKLNMEVFKRILMTFGENEDEIFQKRHITNQQWLNNNQTPKAPTKPSVNLDEIKAQLQKPSLPQFRPSYNFRPPSSSSMTSSNSQQIDSTKRSTSDSSTSSQQQEHQDPNDPVRLWEEGWHERYYISKFNVDSDRVNEYRTQVVEHYTRGLSWVLQYYYHGVPSWNWYYPYYYAPFASDFNHGGNIFVEFNEHSEPFKPLEQLMSVLPPQCAKYLPEIWQPLLLEKTSPIIDFYPSRFSIDPNGKRYESDYIAVLPFIEEERLHRVLESNYSSLTLEEKERNVLENDLLFIHSKNSDYGFLKRELDTNSGNRITCKNPLRIPPTINLPGSIWQDDDDNRIVYMNRSIQAPLSNYRNIPHNQVMCVKYRCLSVLC